MINIDGERFVSTAEASLGWLTWLTWLTSMLMMEANLHEG